MSQNPAAFEQYGRLKRYDARREQSTHSAGRYPCRRQQSSSSMTSTSRDFNGQRQRSYNAQTRSRSSHRRREQNLSSGTNNPNRAGVFSQEMSGKFNGFRDNSCPRPPYVNHVPQRSYEQRQTKMRRVGTNPNLPTQFTLDEEDPRVLQWNEVIPRQSRLNQPRRRKGGENEVFDKQARSMTNLSSPEEFFGPRSPLDNLLGTGVMDMYTAACSVPPPTQYPELSGSGQQDLRGFSTGMPDSYAFPTLNRFQQSCVRSLASMILCPHTVLPITVGLFSRLGVMKDSGYLQRLSEEISLLTSTNPLYFHQNRIHFGFVSSILPLVITLLLAYILGLALGWQLGLAVGATASVLYVIAFCVIFCGVHVKKRPKAMQLAETLSRYMRRCNLIFNILFFRAPAAPSKAQPVKLLPISLNLSECVTGMDAAALMTEKLWTSIERKYGKPAVRIQWASKDVYTISANSARKICCIPAWLWLCVNVISCLSLGTLLVVSETGSAPTSLPVTNRPHQSSTGGGTKEDAADSNYHIRNGMIASSILFSLTLIVLIIGILPTFVRLILGRPFLRNKHRVLYDSSGQPVEPPADGCYGAVAAGFDPAACIRFDNGPQGFTDQGARDYQYQLMQQNLTSAATVAAAAAAAAVTAADRQWRIMEGGRRQSKSRRGKAHGGQKPNGNSFFSPNKSLGKANDVESNLSESCSPSGTSDDEEDGSSSEKSNENESEIENRRHSEALLYESGELLINKRKQEKHKKWKAKRRKSSVLSRAKAGDVKAITKWKETIRKALMDACNVLSMIDGRIGGRQTRVIFCISGAGFLPGTNTALMKLANFLRLVDRLLMQPPDGGSSNDVVVMLPPMNTGQSNKEKNAKESDPSLPPTAWTPNVIVLITARIPAYSYPVEGNSYGYLGSAQARELSRSRSSLNAPPFQWTNFKIWWSIHHVCHLPLYLEEDPPGFMAKRPADFNLSSKTYQQQPAYNLPKNASLLNVYLGPHELADLNEKRIRQLVTLTAFMGRMINIDRLVMGQPGLIRLTSNVPKVDANQPSLFTLTTWLSLLVHWPFHAAWLVLFIERHFQSHRVEETQQLDSSRTRRTSSLGGGSCSLRRTQSAGSDDAVLGDGSQPEKSDPIDWDSPLSQLHGRVLKRLASAIESARLKALSASLNAAQTSLDMTPRRGLAYPPHVISTLEICDLALRDRNPKRLAAFLHNLTPGQDVADQAAGATVDWRGALIKSMQPPWHAGMVTVGQLIQVMHLTPFMNPQIINWIRDILFSKVTASESAVTSKSERTTPQRVSVTSETAVKAQRTPPLGSSKLAERSGSKETSQQTQIRESTCPIRLEHGLPSKKLSQLTVNEVCRLLRDIKDLSFNRPVSSKREKHPSMKSRLPRNQSGVGVVNHPQGSDESEGLINDLNPPAPTDRSGEIGEGMQSKFFEERLRHLNVTGSVLSICSLTDLQKELGMSFGDWQLFSALIGHLRSLEGNADKAVGVVNQESGYIRSQLQSTGGGVAPKIPKTKPMTSTTSDTSLALTVKSAPPAEMNPLGAGPSHSRSCKPAKSMISLSTGEGLMARPSEAMWASRGTSAEPGVRSGRERTNREFIAYHHNQHIPGLKDNAEKGLEFPSVVLCPRHQEQVKHLLLETEHGRELQKKLVQSQSELNTTENTNPKGNTEAIRRTDSSFRRSQGMGRYPEVPDNSRPTRFTASMDRSRTLPKSFPVNGEEGETVELANQPNIQFCPTHQLQRDRRQWGAIRTDPLKNIPQTEVQYLRKTVAGRPQIYTKTNQNSSDLFQMGQIPGDSSKIQGYKKDTQFYGLYRVPVLNSNVMNPLEQPLGQSLQEESSAPKDSGSTSIAGEMAEEVAELSPAHPAQESSNSQETEGKSDQDKPEYSDQISGDCCNCSYLYSLEAAAAEAQRTVIDQHEGVRSDEEESRSEQENSTSDTLSTTRSQLDASSGTTSERTTTESSNEHIDRLA